MTRSRSHSRSPLSAAAKPRETACRRGFREPASPGWGISAWTLLTFDERRVTSPAAARRGRGQDARRRPAPGVADPSRGTRVAIGIPLAAVLATALWVYRRGRSARDVVADGDCARRRSGRGGARRRPARAAQLVHGSDAGHRPRRADRRPTRRRRGRHLHPDHPTRVGLAPPGRRGWGRVAAGPDRRHRRAGAPARGQHGHDQSSGRRDGGGDPRERRRPVPDHARAPTRRSCSSSGPSACGSTSSRACSSSRSSPFS